MAQRKPNEKASLEQVLKLADQLTPDEQDKLVEQMKINWLRRELGKSAESLDRGEGVSSDVVFAELEAEYERRKAND